MLSVKKFKPVLFSLAAVLLSAIVIVCIFSFNLSFNFAGGVQYQIRIGEQIQTSSGIVDMDKNNYKEIRQTIREVLKDNKISGTITRQGTGSNQKYIVRVTDNKFETIDADKILADFNKEITDIVDYQADFEKVKPSVPFQFILWAIVALIILMALLFFVLWMAINIYAGAFASAGMLLGTLLMLALLSLTRIPFDLITLAICLMGGLWFAVEAVSQFMRINAEWKERHKDESISETINKFINEDLKRTIAITCMFIVCAGGLAVVNLASLALIFVPMVSFISLSYLVYPLFTIVCENKKLMPRLKATETTE